MAHALLFRERKLVGVALALIAAHTLLDTVLAPERGTTAAEHVAAALVPLSLLAAIAFVYRRLRPGARAAAVGGLAVLSLVGAALAVADARSTFDRASDWTGFLLAPVAVLLLALAGSLLWSSRRGGRRRVPRRLALGAVVGAYWLVAPVTMALVATHRPRAHVVPAPRGYREVELKTADGLRLAAWYAPSRNGAAIVSFPTRVGKPDHARLLRRHGYGVLRVDMRGYDGSEGSANAFGWGAVADLDAAVAWLALQPDVEHGRVGGIGFSVGAEQLLEAAAGQHGLRAVVADGAGERSVRETWLRGARAALALPEALVQTAAVAVLSDTLPPPSLARVAGRLAPTAVLFVHAERGSGGEELAAVYFRAAREPKEIWRVPGAGHTGGLDARPAEYERRVVGFFDRYLLAAAPSSRAGANASSSAVSEASSRSPKSALAARSPHMKPSTLPWPE